ncbi:hypothetical protein A9K97_gp450 [Tokyovirus A1]|uniref:hypothetical protein n=1 Tax=Tokyovirus A1 TaxID=1826170 RepID=UPI0007A96B48|nr:hypothetical protein A9K97_gp450 [Tokyovirus A1]BAU79901.1 hypothetical protein [Tokyovirus A1]
MQDSTGLICLTHNDKLWRENVVRLEKSSKIFIADAPVLLTKRTENLEEDWKNVIQEFDKKFTKVPGHEWLNYYFADIKSAILTLHEVIDERERREYARLWVDNWGKSHQKLRKLTKEYEEAFLALWTQEPFLSSLMEKKFAKYKKKSIGLDWQQHYLKKLKRLVRLTEEWIKLSQENSPFGEQEISLLRDIKNLWEEDSTYVQQGEKTWLLRLGEIAKISPSCAHVLSQKYIKYKRTIFRPTSNEKRRDFIRGWKLNKMNSAISDDMSLLRATKKRVEIEKKYAPGGEEASKAKEHFESLVSTQ